MRRITLAIAAAVAALAVTAGPASADNYPKDNWPKSDTYPKDVWPKSDNHVD